MKHLLLALFCFVHVVRADLVLHIRGEGQAFANNDPIDVAADLSASSNEARQTDAGKRPLFKTDVLNSKDGFLFDGIDNFLALDANLGVADFTAHIVLQPTNAVSSSSVGMGVLGRSSASFPRGALYLGPFNGFFTNEATTFTQDEGGNWRGRASSLGWSGAHVLTIRLSGSTAAIWLDNVQIDNIQSSGSNMDSSNPNRRFSVVDIIGAYSSTDSFFDGYIFEVRVYDTAQTEAERRATVDELGDYYAISTGSLTPASLAQADVQAACDYALAGEIVTLPPGSATWTGTLGIGKGITLQGAGAISSTDGGLSTTGSDLTIITDNSAVAGHNLMSCSVPDGETVRITGISFVAGPSFAPTNSAAGLIYVGGGDNSVRIDHCHFTFPGDGSLLISVNGSNELLTGVIDHNYFDSEPGFGPVGVYLQNGYSHNSRYNNGDESWSQPDDWGTNKFIFVEDNRFRNGLCGDANRGGQRFVYRYNKMVDEYSETTGYEVMSYLANHGLTNDRHRSTRAVEYYKNIHELGVGGVKRPKAPLTINGGCGLIWGNTISDSHTKVFNIDYTRKSNATYNYGTPPSGWGNSDGTTGTVWDGAPNGYPALDQPGRGQGDMLGFDPDPGNGGGTIAATINTRTGTQAHVVQALSPMYVWGNIFDAAETVAVTIAAPSALVQFNREVYQQFGPGGEAGSFDGTAGVGEGLLAARPSSGLVAGVGYWATDTQTLYVATSATTWVTYYQPYTYPHPLTAGDPEPPASPSRKVGRPIRSPVRSLRF